MNHYTSNKSPTPISPYFYKGAVGHLLTKDYNDHFISRDVIKNIINHTDQNCLPSIKAAAQLKLAEMNYAGEGRPVNYETARQCYAAIFATSSAPAEDRAYAQYKLAFMDYFSRDATANYINARQGFASVVKNTAAFPGTKGSAQLLLAKMDFWRRKLCYLLTANPGFSRAFRQHCFSSI